MSESSPVPMVPRMAGNKRRLKKARGFSLGELQQAGIQRIQAASMHIRTDQRRRSVHADNVAALKRYLAASKEAAVVEQSSQEAHPKAPEASKEPAPTVSKREVARPRTKKRKG